MLLILLWFFVTTCCDNLCNNFCGLCRVVADLKEAFPMLYLARDTDAFEFDDNSFVSVKTCYNLDLDLIFFGSTIYQPSVP